MYSTIINILYNYIIYCMINNNSVILRKFGLVFFQKQSANQQKKNTKALLNAVKCNLTELTTRSTSLTFAVSGLLDMRMCQDSSGAWSIGRCSSFVGVLAFSER